MRSLIRSPSSQEKHLPRRSTWRNSCAHATGRGMWAVPTPFSGSIPPLDGFSFRKWQLQSSCSFSVFCAYGSGVLLYFLLVFQRLVITGLAHGAINFFGSLCRKTSRGEVNSIFFLSTDDFVISRRIILIVSRILFLFFVDMIVLEVICAIQVFWNLI